MIHYETDQVTIWHGDCIDVMRELPDASVDAVVTDPPYNLTAGKKGGTGAASVNLDSPYGRARISTGNGGGGFMGKGWDDYDSYVREDGSPGSFQHWCEDWAREAHRVLKPGGHLLAFGGTRTHHRLTAGIEDAGFEIRDSIAWLYGSGFPKSLDVSKAIDKAQRRDYVIAAQALGIPLPARSIDDWTKEGHAPGDKWWAEFRAHLPAEDWQRIEREVVGTGKSGAASVAYRRAESSEYDVTAPATADAARWQGWGTALKPAFEPIVVARKPLSGTVAQTVLQYGTGALNIDASRIGTTREVPASHSKTASTVGAVGISGKRLASELDPNVGRWPANVVLDASQAAALDAQSGTSSSPFGVVKQGGRHGFGPGGTQGAQRDGEGVGYGDTGGASRFFKTVAPDVPFRYTAKAGGNERPKVEREGGGNGTQNYGGYKVKGCECGRRFAATFHACPACGRVDGWAWVEQQDRQADTVSHPTVKPLDLMRWLVRLVTPKGGTVLEPFAGSGTTVEAAVLEGFRCIAIEREADYLPLIMQRIGKPHAVGLDFDFPEEPAPAPVARPVGNGRDREASAARRYTERGGTNFAPLPGRRIDERPPRPEPELPDAFDFGDWEEDAS